MQSIPIKGQGGFAQKVQDTAAERDMLRQRLTRLRAEIAGRFRGEDDSWVGDNWLAGLIRIIDGETP